MRNLKKVLSLALALVMLIGMMVIGAGAVETDFADDGKIGDDYKEAVAVMNAIGVLNGKENNNFDPQGTLTRAEAAAILVRMTMGTEAAKGLANVNKSGVFTDMADHWAAGYVDACYNQGIVLGMAQGIYGPNNTLTGTQFATMLLRAIGVEGEFTGNAWESAVIAAANKAGLSGVTTGSIAREAASKMAFDGLLYSPSGEKTFVVTVSGTDYSFSSAAEAYFFSQANSNAPVKMTTASDSLAKNVFDLVSNDGEDAFGNPVKEWQVKGDVVVTVEGADPVVSYTTAVTSVSRDLKGYSPASGLKATVNGEEGSAVRNLTDLQTLTGNGKLVNVYASDKTINKVVVVEYTAGTLNVTESRTRTTYTVGALTGVDYVDEDTTDTVVFHGTAEKDDVVTAARVSGTLHIYPTTVVNGSVTAMNISSATITVDGERFVIGSTITGVDSLNNFRDNFLGKDSVNVYIDVNGVVVRASTEDTAAAAEYCYVASAGGSFVSSVDGADANIDARVVLSDGTVSVYRLNTKHESNHAVTVGGVTVVDNDSTSTTMSSGWNSNLVGKAYAYSIDDNNRMTLTAVDADDQIAANKTVKSSVSSYKGTTSKTSDTNSKTILFNNSTVFVAYNAGSKTATVVTGRNNLGTVDLGGEVVVSGSNSSSGVAKIFFVTSGTISAAATGDYAYVDASEYETVRISNTLTRVYKAIDPNGEEVELTIADSDAGTVNDDTVYYYNADNVITGKVLTSVAKKGTATVRSELISVDGTNYYAIDEDVQIVYIDENASGVDGSKVVFVLDNNNAVVIYVTAASVEEEPAPEKPAEGTAEETVIGSEEEKIFNTPVETPVTVKEGGTLTLTNGVSADGTVTAEAGSTVSISGSVAAGTNEDEETVPSVVVDGGDVTIGGTIEAGAVKVTNGTLNITTVPTEADTIVVESAATTEITINIGAENATEEVVLDAIKLPETVAGTVTIKINGNVVQTVSKSRAVGTGFQIPANVKVIVGGDVEATMGIEAGGELTVEGSLDSVVTAKYTSTDSFAKVTLKGGQTVPVNVTNGNTWESGTAAAKGALKVLANGGMFMVKSAEGSHDEYWLAGSDIYGFIYNCGTEATNTRLTIKKGNEVVYQTTAGTARAGMGGTWMTVDNLTGLVNALNYYEKTEKNKDNENAAKLAANQVIYEGDVGGICLNGDKLANGDYTWTVTKVTLGNATEQTVKTPASYNVAQGNEAGKYQSVTVTGGDTIASGSFTIGEPAK